MAASSNKAAGSTPFDFIDQCRSKKEVYPYTDKTRMAFMLMKGISNYNYDLRLCNAINQNFFDIPDEVVYRYFFEALPKGKVYSKWPKKKVDKELEKKLEALCEQYDISRQEAEEFRELL